MNTTIKSLLVSMLFIMGIVQNAYSQVHYDTLCETNPDLYSTAIGSNCKAYGKNSFAGGWNSRAGIQGQGPMEQLYTFAFGYNAVAEGRGSLALGYSSLSEGHFSAAIGTHVQALAYNSFIIGCGGSMDYPLINDKAGIMFGVNSERPTMFISKASLFYTGKVAIGNTTDPQAKLHIKGDVIEDADILLETTSLNDAKIMFINKDCSFIKVRPTGEMTITVPDKPIHFNALRCCVGSDYTYLANKDDTTFLMKSPIKILLQSEEIQLSGSQSVAMDAQQLLLNGKVGINAENNIEGFSLAVEGGIITDEVLIKDIGAWHDYVFGKNYGLMPLNELKAYISDHQHLPDVPSEQEVMENGIELSEMQGILLKKIEELTLYTLKQQEIIENLQNRIEELERK